MCRLIDCFPFFNELDLLTVRLHELDPVVDRFVLCEATRTFSGKDKPLHFAENRDRYARFLHKIVHVVVEDLPATGNPWDAEAFQRDAILRGLADCAPSADDLIVLSDADEIPRRAVVESFDGDDAALRMSLYYHYLNCMSSKSWASARISRYGRLGLPNTKRTVEVATSILPSAGWHFSYLGGPEAIRRKMESFSHHRELDLPQYTNDANIARALREGVLIWDLPGTDERFQRVPIDNSYPEFILQNREMFDRYTWKDT